MSKKNNVYPNDLYSNLKKNTTLSVTDGLVKNGTSSNGTISPYSVYDDRMSRITFTIISKSNGKTMFPSANISEKEIHGIIERSRAAENANIFVSLPFIKQLFLSIKEVKNICNRVVNGMEILYGKVTNTNVKNNNNAKKNLPADFGQKARTIQIMNGEFKGKTPVQILSESSDNVQKLKSQYDWLKQNLPSYPKNQIQMDAIKEAIYMFENGLLDKNQANDVLEAGQIKLYEAVPKALIRKKDPKTGLCPVYEIAILWTLGDKYPISIRIDNYEAPVRENSNGMLNPDRSKAVNREFAIHRLSETEWFSCVYRIESHMRRYEYLLASNQFREAKNMIAQAKSNYENNNMNNMNN